MQLSEDMRTDLLVLLQCVLAFDFPEDGLLHCPHVVIRSWAEAHASHRLLLGERLPGSCAEDGTALVLEASRNSLRGVISYERVVKVH